MGLCCSATWGIMYTKVVCLCICVCVRTRVCASAPACERNEIGQCAGARWFRFQSIGNREPLNAFEQGNDMI